jgi:hypothetical protein
MTVTLLLLFARLTAEAAEPLRFQPTIQREDLAEEAIALLHCLAERSGAAWEFGPESGGSHRLELREEKGLLHGSYVDGDNARPVHLALGQADSVCNELRPLPVSLAPVADTGGSEIFPDGPEAKKNVPWLWAGVTAAVLGGVLLWKVKSGPEHRSLRME